MLVPPRAPSSEPTLPHSPVRNTSAVNRAWEQDALGSAGLSSDTFVSAG